MTWRDDSAKTCEASVRDRTQENEIAMDTFWLRPAEAQVYVGCKTIKAWYQWRRRHGIVARGNGTVNRADLDRELRPRAARPQRGGGAAGHPHSLANLLLGPTR